MTETDPETKAEIDAPVTESIENDTPSGDTQRPKEIGGRGGLDPTRYGDWEKSGRCIDF